MHGCAVAALMLRLPVAARRSMQTLRPALDALKFNPEGLIPAVVQDGEAGPGEGRVLMLAWMNRESLEKTLETGLLHFLTPVMLKSLQFFNQIGHGLVPIFHQLL